MEPTRPAAAPPLGVLVKIYPKISETFILEEILGLERLGRRLCLYALSPATDAIVHPAVAQVKATLRVAPPLSAASLRRYASDHATQFLRGPRRYLGALAAGMRRGRGGLADFLRSGWLAARLQEDGVSHLHSHFIATPADVAEGAARLAQLPFSISAHAKDIYLSQARDLRRRLTAARFTVTCTDVNRAVLSAIAPQARVSRMYHGVDHALFHPARRLLPADGPALIVSVGRLRAKKGLDVLIDAVARLRAQGQDVEAEIVGYGPEHAALAAQIEALGLHGRVRLVGKLAREQVIERYARAAVYVQPARIAADGDRDGIPNVLLEAMAMGLPVVATRVSGIPELVTSGVNGVLVAPDDPDELAAAIGHLLARPQACASLACQARETVVRAFDNGRNLQLLCALLDGERTPAPTPRAATADAPAWSLE